MNSHRKLIHSFIYSFIWRFNFHPFILVQCSEIIQLIDFAFQIDHQSSSMRLLFHPQWPLVHMLVYIYKCLLYKTRIRGEAMLLLLVLAIQSVFLPSSSNSKFFQRKTDGGCCSGGGGGGWLRKPSLLLSNWQMTIDNAMSQFSESELNR